MSDLSDRRERILELVRRATHGERDLDGAPLAGPYLEEALLAAQTTLESVAARCCSECGNLKKIVHTSVAGTRLCAGCAARIQGGAGVLGQAE